MMVKKKTYRYADQLLYDFGPISKPVIMLLTLLLLFSKASHYNIHSMVKTQNCTLRL